MCDYGDLAIILAADHLVTFIWLSQYRKNKGIKLFASASVLGSIIIISSM